METISSETLDEGQAASPRPVPGRVSFLRAAAGFILEDSVDVGFADPEPAPEPPPAVDVAGAPGKAEVVETVDPPTMAVPPPSRPTTPSAHRLMMFVLLPFLVIAIGGMAMITFSSSQRRQPAPGPRVATTPAAPTAASTPPPTPATTVAPPRLAEAPVPRPASVPVPVTRAPRVAPTTTAPVATSVPVTETSQPPAPEPPVTTTTEPPATTTTTTEPPSTTTTQPTTITTVQ